MPAFPPSTMRSLADLSLAQRELSASFQSLVRDDLTDALATLERACAMYPDDDRYLGMAIDYFALRLVRHSKLVVSSRPDPDPPRDFFPLGQLGATPRRRPRRHPSDSRRRRRCATSSWPADGVRGPPNRASSIAQQSRSPAIPPRRREPAGQRTAALRVAYRVRAVSGDPRASFR